jgi:hypothetical protein
MPLSEDVKREYAAAIPVLGVSREELFADALDAYLPTLRARLMNAKRGRRPDPKAKMEHDGQPCRKCGTPVTMRTRSKPPAQKGLHQYYFNQWLTCPNRSCRTIYFIEESKVWFDGDSTVANSATVQLSANIGQLTQAADSAHDGAPPWD